MTLSIAVSYYQQYCHYQFKALTGYILWLSISNSMEILGDLYFSIPPHFVEEHAPMHWLLILVTSLEGMMPPLYRQ